MTGKSPDRSKTVLHRIFADYVEFVRTVKGGNAKTVKNVRFGLEVFQTFLDVAGIAAEKLTGKVAARIFADSPYEPGTNRVMAVQVSAAYARAVRQTMAAQAGDTEGDDYGVTRNPLGNPDTFRMPRPPKPNPTEKIISTVDLRKMRARCAASSAAPNALGLWALLVFTGLRRDEVRRLTWEDIDWDSRTLTILGKGAKWRTVPLHDELVRVLEKTNPAHVWTGAVLTPDGTYNGGKVDGPYGESSGGFARLLASFSDAPFHNFRKTFATSLARNGVNPDAIDEMLGWEATSVRANYYMGFGIEDAHEAVSVAYVKEGGLSAAPKEAGDDALLPAEEVAAGA